MANTNTVHKKSTKNTVLRVLFYVVIILVCLFTLYPYFVTVCTALKSRAEIFSMNGTVFPVESIWSNFIDVWKLAPMGNYMINSIVIAGGSTLLAMVCGIPAAYALSRMKSVSYTHLDVYKRQELNRSNSALTAATLMSVKIFTLLMPS